MFGQDNFGELVYAQQANEDTTIFPTWGIKCPTETAWINLPKDSIGIVPCNQPGVNDAS
jgi:hypothetical protein